MKERDITQRLQNHLKRKGWLVYKPPDTYGTPIQCPNCAREGKEHLLYCRECSAYVPRDESSRFTPYKPADLVVLDAGGGLIEVKRVTARTEKGMTFRPKYVKPHQIKALEKANGYLALAFVQLKHQGKPELVGLYMLRWSQVRDMECITRAQARELAEHSMIDKSEVTPVKKVNHERTLLDYMDGGKSLTGAEAQDNIGEGAERTGEQQ